MSESGDRTPAQLPFELPHVAALGREDFLVGESNRAAYELVVQWPDWPSPFALIAGPVGAGKSHLVSIWRDISSASVIRARDLASAGAVALGQKGAVAVEDAHEPGLDQTALFHLMNAAREAGHSVLLTSRSWPASWDLTLPDLASRLRLATPVDVQEPDDDLLRRVLIKLFADRQIPVDASVVEYLVVRMERSLEAANTIVAELDRVALAAGRKVSRKLAATLLDARH